MNGTIVIKETDSFGPILVCSDAEIFDALEDFLTEDCGKCFSVKFVGGTTEIYFDSPETIEHIRTILEKFQLRVPRGE